ncbi:MAG: Cytidylate kinase [Candidatus Uhrbacteria bacterium GW2011_GWD2_52_7]|uniref:Cytidylate kinase n=1 Tax=Candidatus Uhrbacteria bacterium GW2011_GWD2_52_7 TaxID=1618989 RepID=A0A0G1XI28_9BACT|nr:MAG: Cytidylate kinase [Candidatus Uhrbacteria bacterium GW2011_GWD2_52_7]
MIIALSGLAGSGKSTIKSMLAKRLGYKAYSVGDLRGKMALDRGITIDQLNDIGMEHDYTDKDVDNYQTQLGKQEDNFVIDGWLSWFFIPHAVKVFLSVDPDEGARRIYEAKKNNPQARKDEPDYPSVEAAKAAIAARTASNASRYKKWYNADFLDLSHYDLVIDTTSNPPEEVVRIIQDYLQLDGPGDFR